MAALQSLTDPLTQADRVVIEADLVEARADRDAYTTRLRQLEQTGDARVHREKLEYQIGVLDRWIRRYERQLAA